MHDLTEREAEIVRLRDDEGLSWAAIAKQLGTSKSSVNSSYRAACRKRDASGPESRAHGNSTEVRRPEETAEALDLATDPFATVKEAARKCGFPETTLRRLIHRMEARYKPMADGIREVKEGELLKLLEDRALRCVEHIDDVTLAGATVKDLAIAGGIMIDKARLLRGEPTQIMRVEDRRKLGELAEALHHELERRHAAGVIDVTPQPAKEPSQGSQGRRKDIASGTGPIM
jgi:predicted DNA-binding protein (UPF0251 family)